MSIPEGALRLSRTELFKQRVLAWENVNTTGEGEFCSQIASERSQQAYLFIAKLLRAFHILTMCQESLRGGIK